MCGLPTASLSILLPDGGPGRAAGRVGRVKEASNVDQELQLGVTLGLRVVTLGCDLTPKGHPASLSMTNL